MSTPPPPSRPPAPAGLLAVPQLVVILSTSGTPANFNKSSLAGVGDDARFFAGDREGSCVGWAWRGHAVAQGPVAHGRAVPKRGILKQAEL